MYLLFKIKDTYLSAKQIHFTTSHRELLQDSQHKENQLNYASALLHPTVISQTITETAKYVCGDRWVFSAVTALISRI